MLKTNSDEKLNDNADFKEYQNVLIFEDGLEKTAERSLFPLTNSVNDSRSDQVIRPIATATLSNEQNQQEDEFPLQNSQQ